MITYFFSLRRRGSMMTWLEVTSARGFFVLFCDATQMYWGEGGQDAGRKLCPSTRWRQPPHFLLLQRAAPIYTLKSRAAGQPKARQNHDRQEDSHPLQLQEATPSKVRIPTNTSIFNTV